MTPHPQRGEARVEDGDYFKDATGLFEAYVSANEAEPPWPAMVSYEWDQGGSLLSDDARALAAKLTAAADEADRRTEQAFSALSTPEGGTDGTG